MQKPRNSNYGKWMLYISKDGKAHLLLQKLPNYIRLCKRRLPATTLSGLNPPINKYLNPYYLIYITSLQFKMSTIEVIFKLLNWTNTSRVSPCYCYQSCQSGHYPIYHEMGKLSRHGRDSKPCSQ